MTKTSSFGVSERSSHDASSFYARFSSPVFSDDSNVLQPTAVRESFFVGDSRCMDDVVNGSVGLVVTSPPYFVGKEYELNDHATSSFSEYLEMLEAVFNECIKKLEPGGRLAVNVANLGRKPYRSLSSIVARLLEDLGMFLRGEIIWQKAAGAAGSCAWGSFCSPTNPVLRDTTERIIVASKGRMDRAIGQKTRKEMGLPWASTITSKEFMELTLDVWKVGPESAKKIGHPAPFPVEIPRRLIELYTFANDLVLDPFMGSGTTLVAASRAGRRFVGYDLDPGYVQLARERVSKEGFNHVID